MRVVLASASERRHELLRRIASDFDIVVSGFDESKVEYCGDSGEYVKEISRQKAFVVGSTYSEEAIIIGCDTIVALKERILGKPKDKAEAFNMLKNLSGNVHEVYSGIALYNTVTKQSITDYVKTEVKFSALSDKDINAYINTGEPMDKAGAYGIQGYGGVFVEEIHGCYYNVVGLPLSRLKFLMKEMGVNL